LTPALVQAICDLRCRLARGPAHLGWLLQLSPSTVYAVLRRAGLHRLERLDRLTRAVVRYEHELPGDLLHLDVKKLWRIPPGGGRHFELTPDGGESISRQGKRGHGYDYLHVAIDDHSRYLYAELLPNQRATTTTAFLARTLQHFEALSVKVRRVLTDNAMNYRSKELRRLARKQRIQLKKTRPYRPQTNGKAERVIQTLLREWAYLRPYPDNDSRAQTLPLYLNSYNLQRPHSALGRLPPIARICNQPP
jgi:transposase InsO family protein